MSKRLFSLVATLLVVCLLVVAPMASAQDMTKVTVVLQWVAQAQFAGYYAAQSLGYYSDAGLDVTIVPGGPDISADQIVAAGEAEFGVRPFVTTLAAREGGADFVSIARVNQVPPTLLVSFKSAGIEKPEDLKGHNVGSWLGGNEMEEFALLRQFNIDPDKDVTIVKQGFDMSQLINGEVEVAQATIYNEFAQLLETTNPDTGELYTMDDLNVISVRDYGINTLQDNIFARESWLAEDGNEDVALNFVQATLKGWIYCRDNVAECVSIVLDSGTALGESHQTWMMNEFNNLLWPAPNGIGILNQGDEFDTTVEIAKTYNLITADPDPAVFRTDIVEKAVANLDAEGLDTKGLDYKKLEVTLNPGGE
ncbi:MAG: ABC transporter substrate-binding protein [Anaerolineae bacterium]